MNRQQYNQIKHYVRQNRIASNNFFPAVKDVEPSTREAYKKLLNLAITCDMLAYRAQLVEHDVRPVRERIGVTTTSPRVRARLYREHA